jgi:DNA-binding NtrC family response regulator
VSARISATLQGRADVSIAATFDEAKAILIASPPAVLITGVRLGQFNGLHLVIRSRIDHPETASFVILEKPDAAAEQEAAAHGAISLEYPVNEKELLMLVAAALDRVGR